MKRSVILIFLFLGGLNTIAQDPATLLGEHRYTQVIEMLAPKLSSASARDRMVLLRALKSRGDLLLDAADLMAAFGYEYYQFRDTCQSVAKARHTSYFLARYALEMGQKQQALELFERAGTLEDPYRQLAAIWRQAVKGMEVQSSADTPRIRAELPVVNLWMGKESQPVKIGGNDPAARRFELWHRARNQNGKFDFLKGGLFAGIDPDFSEKVDEKLVTYFYDPVCYRILAIADYSAALSVAKQLGGQHQESALLMGGICAYGAGLWDEAETLLKQINNPVAAIYLGGIAAKRADMNAAGKFWSQAALNLNNTTVAELCRIAGRYRWNGLRPDDWIRQSTNQAVMARVADVYIKTGQSGRAIEALESLNISSGRKKNDLAAYDPSYLIILSLARFEYKTALKTGRAASSGANTGISASTGEILGTLVDLQNEFPFMNACHAMGQASLYALGLDLVR